MLNIWLIFSQLKNEWNNSLQRGIEKDMIRQRTCVCVRLCCNSPEKSTLEHSLNGFGWNKSLAELSHADRPHSLILIPHTNTDDDVMHLIHHHYYHGTWLRFRQSAWAHDTQNPNAIKSSAIFVKKQPNTKRMFTMALNIQWNWINEKKNIQQQTKILGVKEERRKDGERKRREEIDLAWSAYWRGW